MTFNETSKNVAGNNSCNAYSAPFKLEGETVSFGEPRITTMMYCGEGEKVFLNTMKKINKYSFDDYGKLNLMVDDIPMMWFHKIQ
ncbi:META domain-containing protein [Flavobacteriaceae bacterium GSB9]|nr:META domain-containing protein [Flavobacteriaceae bacterium GSB9]